MFLPWLLYTPTIAVRTGVHRLTMWYIAAGLNVLHTGKGCNILSSPNWETKSYVHFFSTGPSLREIFCLMFCKVAVITQHMFHHKLCFMILHGSLFIADTLRPGSKRTRTYSRSDDSSQIKLKNWRIFVHITKMVESKTLKWIPLEVCK